MSQSFVLFFFPPIIFFLHVPLGLRTINCLGTPAVKHVLWSIVLFHCDFSNWNLTVCHPSSLCNFDVVSLSLNIKKIKDLCLEFLSMNSIHFDVIMISLQGNAKWHTRRNTVGDIYIQWNWRVNADIQAACELTNIIWISFAYFLLYSMKKKYVRYWLLFIVPFILFFLNFLHLVLLSSSSRTPVMWCIDLWSYVSSPTGVMWNILVFTASVCMDKSLLRLTDDSPTLSEIIFIMLLFKWYINQ